MVFCAIFCYNINYYAEVAKLADAYGLGPYGATRGSSTLPLGTIKTKNRPSINSGRFFVLEIYDIFTPIFPLPPSFLGIFIVRTPLSIWASALSISMFSGKTIFLENGPQ